jgi:hypothetical protein
MTYAVHPSILTTLRTRYYATWGIDWPESDTYLSSLWHSAQSRWSKPQKGMHAAKVYELALDLMRENHEFDANADLS